MAISSNSAASEEKGSDPVDLVKFLLSRYTDPKSFSIIRSRTGVGNRERTERGERRALKSKAGVESRL